MNLSTNGFPSLYTNPTIAPPEAFKPATLALLANNADNVLTR
jgi:hypothetical protein